MQGLVSYSDDEDSSLPVASTSTLDQPQSSASAFTAGSASTASPGASFVASTSRRPVGGPSSSSTARLNRQPALANVVRKPQPQIASVVASSSSSLSSSSRAYPSSPLRRAALNDEAELSMSTVAESSKEGEGASGLDEAEEMRLLLRPNPLRNGKGFEEAYGLNELAASFAQEPPDEALQAKISQFLALKARGTHFNDSLMRSRAFRNPTIYKKLVEFVDVDERKGVSRGVWEWEEGESKMWNATRIAELQKARLEKAPAPGSRSSIPFTSSASSSSSTSHLHSQHHYPPNPLLQKADKQAALRHALSRPAVPPAAAPLASVPSGGKQYGYVGVGADLLGMDPLADRDRGKRKSGKDRERDGQGKVSRWA